MVVEEYFVLVYQPHSSPSCVCVCQERVIYSLKCIFFSLTFNNLPEDDEEEDAHLVPNSADNAPRVTNQLQGSVGDANAVPSRPSGRIVGVIKRNWHS